MMGTGMRNNKWKKLIAVILCLSMIFQTEVLTMAVSPEEQPSEALSENSAEEAGSAAEQAEESLQAESSGIAGEETPSAAEGEAAEESLDTAEISGGGLTAPETADEAEEAAAFHEELELIHEITDEKGEVRTTVKAQIPADSFEAGADEITMEVSVPGAGYSEHVNNLIRESLPENQSLGRYIYYKVSFLVNGEESLPSKAVTLTYEGTGLSLKGSAGRSVFIYNEKAGDYLTELPSLDHVIQILEADGADPALAETYDTFTITEDEEETAQAISMEVRLGGIIGCYTTCGQEDTQQEDAQQDEEEQKEDTQKEDEQQQENTQPQETEAPQEVAADGFGATYDDGTVKITVDAEAGSLPDSARMKVEPVVQQAVPEDADDVTKEAIESINAQYEATEKTLTESAKAADRELGGFLAYDISFWVEGKDGVFTEIEPLGPVNVNMEFTQETKPEENKEVPVEEDEAAAKEKAAADSGQQAPEISVVHLKESGNEVIPEKISSATLQTSEDNTAVSQASFTAESFSIFTITWTYTGTNTSTQIPSTPQEMKIVLVDTDGKELDTGVLSEDQLRKTVESGENHEFVEARIKDVANQILEKTKLNNEYRFCYAYAESDSEKRKIIKFNLWRAPENKETWFQVRYSEQPLVQYNLKKDEKLYFVFEKRQPASELPTTSDNIQINLFNYNGDIHKNTFSDKFRFFNSSYKNIDNPNSNPVAGTETLLTKGQSYAVILENVAEKNLKNGYPLLNRNAFEDRREESLQKIFPAEGDEIEGVKGVTSYHNVSGLFQKDSRGYYYYDSSLNAASYDNGENKIRVYNGTVYSTATEKGQFYPFNPVNPEDKNYPVVYKDELAKYTSKWVDLWFGMTVYFSFSQPEGGLIDKDAMTFSFSGDDDVWVFIDDKLVLDLGGTHAAVTGTINFATGEVTRTGKGKSNIKDLYKAALWAEEMDKPEGERKTEDEFNTWFDTEYAVKHFKQGTNTFKDYTEHELKFFYMERGGSDSNCSLRFNMPPIPKGALSIGKKIEGYEEDINKDEEFQFKLYVKTDEAENFELYRGQVDIYPLVGEIRKNVIEEDGSFKVKHNERAVIEGLEPRWEYYVEECNLSEKYDKVEIISTNGSIVKREDDKNGDGMIDGTHNAVSNSQTVGSASGVTIHNSPHKKKLRKLFIQKATVGEAPANEVFKIYAEINGSPYCGKYTLIEPKKTTPNLTAKDGYIELKAGQMARLEGNITLTEGTTTTTGFLEGSSFLIKEKDSNWYHAEFEIKKGNPISLDNRAEGKLPVDLNNNGEVVITNKFNFIIVEKIVEGYNQAVHGNDDFMISLSDSQIDYSCALKHGQTEMFLLDKGRTMSVQEIVPLEYNQTTGKPVVEIYERNDRDFVKVATLDNGGSYTFKENQQYKVRVINQFAHTSYFHDKASVDNRFSSLKNNSTNGGGTTE